MNLKEVVEQIAAQKVNSLMPSDMQTGTVVSADPLEVSIDVSATSLRASVLLLTDMVREKTITVAGETVEIVPKLAAGEKVLLLQVQHGQKYIILSRL